MGNTNVLQATTGDYSTVSDVNPGGGQDAPGLVPGQLGKSMEVDSDWPGIPAGEEGRIQYVKSKAGSTVAPARGVLAYWDDKANKVVTPDNPGTVGAQLAGVYLGAVAKGEHGFIAKSGRWTLKFLSSTTKTTPAIGDAVVNYGASGLADVLADASAVTFGTDATQANRVIGQLAAAVVSQLALVDLNPIPD